MPLRAKDVLPYLDPERWASLAKVKEASWLSKRQRGPAAQIRAIDELRAFAHSIGTRPSERDREEDLGHHIRVAALMRRADALRD